MPQPVKRPDCLGYSRQDVKLIQAQQYLAQMERRIALTKAVVFVEVLAVTVIVVITQIVY